MSYVNTGAFVDGKRPSSKKALREAVATGLYVAFDVTGAFGPLAGDVLHAPWSRSIGTHTLSVVGPDPYRKRSWYASVTVKPDGSLRVR